jgi:2-polyprenyl-6-methoxyphenol hydroxylase-like FAD-dependent oxidoreductase
MISQPVIEALLSSHISDKVRYGERVVSISEDDTSVHITTDKGRRITSRYAIGADGARSMVRNSLGISFTGTKPEMVWAVLDAFIETDFPQCPEIITFELNGQSRVSWIPRERGLSRFYVMLDGEVTLPRAQESLREHLAPYTIKFREVEWFSTFDGEPTFACPHSKDTTHKKIPHLVKERIASSFVSKDGKGRVFLAGDAAHVHSVNGGQGLNTGISDAFALAWRIAMVLTHKKIQADQSREVLLSYDTERRTTAEMVINVAAVLVRATAHEAKGYVSAIERRAGYITGKCDCRTVNHCGCLVDFLSRMEPRVASDTWESRHGRFVPRRVVATCPAFTARNLESWRPLS